MCEYYDPFGDACFLGCEYRFCIDCINRGRPNRCYSYRCDNECEKKIRQPWSLPRVHPVP